ncbi:AMP-binding protein, partial [Actinocrinis puniceicyclus]
VVAREDRPGVRRLVGYVVLEAGVRVDGGVVRSAVGERLPDYMVPSVVVVLDVLPLTVNGKVDRKALPEITVTGSGAHQGPATAAEEVLCALFAEVLGVERVGVRDGFFDLGGDSIASIQLVARARRAGLALSPRDVFTHRTVAALARVATPLAEAGEGARAAAVSARRPLVELEPAELDALGGPWTGETLEEVLPLAPLQQGFLFHALFDESGIDVYNMQAALDLSGPLDPDLLRRAAGRVVERHACLRAGFPARRDGNRIQAVARRAAAPWRELDLTAVPAARQRARLVAELADERRRRFDVAAPPLLRFTLIKLAPERHVLVFTHHHILLDGWSLPLVLGDLFRCYAANGDASGLPPVVPLRDYLAWIAAQEREEAENAWRGALAGLQSPTLLAASAQSPDEAALPELLTVELPEALTSRLSGWARGCGLTLNTVVQGAWGLLLAGLTGRDDVVFGATVAGRPAVLPGVEDIVGLLMNTVPVRVRLDGAESVAGLLARVQREQAGLGAHHHVGLADIQRLAGLGELFDTAAVFESAPAGAAQFDLPGGLHVAPSDAADATAASHFPLALAAFPGERLRLELNYRRDVFDHDAAELVARRLVALFERIAEQPDTLVARLGLLTASEQETVLRKWNRTELTVPRMTLPQLFEQQAARVPHAPALLCGEQEISYAELDARAGALARVLSARGVGPERIVAVALPRSVDQVVATLAVSKAGGAFLPVDLGYPAERIAFMLRDADPAAVITRGGLPEAVASAAPPFAAGRVIDLDEAEPLAGPLGELAPPDRDAIDGARRAESTAAFADLDGAAYVIYTSGSTGTPKGVVVTHRGIASMAATQQRELGVGEGSRVLQFASPSFDAAVWELCMALLSGAALVLAPAEQLLPGAALVELCERHGVTHATLPPTALVPLRESGALRPGVTLVVAGEACAADAVEYWSRDRLMINAYGPTETTVCATMSAALSGPQSPPIGGPIANTRVYVLDGWLRPVPVGVVGELY